METACTPFANRGMSILRVQIIALVVFVSTMFGNAPGYTEELEEPLLLPEVVVTGAHSSNLSAASQHSITEQDIAL